MVSYVAQGTTMERTIFIRWEEVPDRFIKRDSFLLSNVCNLVLKYCTFSAFYSLGVSGSFSSSLQIQGEVLPNLFIAIPEALKKHPKSFTWVSYNDVLWAVLAEWISVCLIFNRLPKEGS